MPRPRRLTPTSRLEIQLPDELIAKMQFLFFDSLRERAKHGAISGYIESLIREDLTRRGMLK